MKLTQKEISLLNELKAQEQVCVEKYKRYSNEANDNQLKLAFTKIGQHETEHINTLNAILSGVEPTLPPVNNAGETFTKTYATLSTDQKAQADCYLCTDALSSEKHVSSLYDTCVFEFAQPALRQALSHIQKEEQNHGKIIYDYMAANAMYN
ncbi:MAG: spore coat protein [Clostridia bacterium]